MINANELRIGNWVHHFDDGNIQTKSVDINLAENKNHENDYNPIPLTPEILEKCGFATRDDSGIIYYELSIPKDNIAPHGSNVYELSGLRLAGSLDTITISYTVNNHWAARNITSLHQLQNLYFALTSTELEYTP